MKVVTINLYGPPYRTEERATMVAGELTHLQPDIVGLQEVNVAADNGNRICAELNRMLPAGSAPAFRILHVANPGKTVGQGALAVITRLPVIAHEGLDYLIEELEWDRTAQRVQVEGAGQALDFYNTHFHYLLGPEADAIRCEQARRLLAWMDRHGWEVPKILVGDFNAWPDSEAVRLFKERFASAHETVHGQEPEKTWPTPMVKQANAPDWALDYIFASSGVRVLTADLAFTEPADSDQDLYASDHYGLAATIELS